MAQDSFQQAENDVNPDDEATANIEKTSKIDNQKITNISGNEISLENGTKFTVDGNIQCKVGDYINGYDDEKQSLICIGTENNQLVTRYVPVPYNQNSTSNLLTNLILLDYFTSRTYLRNNGYSPTYVNNTTIYKNSNGSEIQSKPNSKPTVTKPTPKSSYTSSKSSSSGKSSSSSSGKGSTIGHGGGFGGGRTGTS